MGKKKIMDKREAITKTALKLLCDEGFQQTSTARISREAGVATGTLFTYFKSKDELIHNLFIESKQDMEESVVSKVWNQEFNDLELIENFWKEAIYWSLNNLDKHRFIRLFKASSYYQSVDVESLHHEYAPHFHSVFQKVLSGMESNLPDELIGQMFMNLYFALVDYLAQHSDIEEKDKLIKESCAVFLKGIGYH